MKNLFLLIAILSLLIAACGTAGASPTPTPPPTATITPAPTQTPIPTPTIETGPEGTVVKTDYLGNRYTVDGEDKPIYFMNEKGGWEKFQPINFTGEYVKNDSELPVVPNIIYITSGYMEQVVMEAGLPKNPKKLSQNPLRAYNLCADKG
jgi:hypothetical protein